MVETPGMFRGNARPTFSFVDELLRELRGAGASEEEVARALTFNLLRYMRFESLLIVRRVHAALSVAAIVEKYGV